MRKKELKFSVIIPAHNEEKEIVRSINSVLNQTYNNFEIIVVNDGSTDKTAGIVKKLINKHKEIKLINFSKGHSAAFARNKGAEEAKGEILIFLDADTYINKIFLEEIAKNFGKADAFITICLPIRNTIVNKALSGFLGRPFKLNLKDGNIYDKDNCKEAGCMFFCITKDAYEKIRGYNEDIFYYEDEDFVNKFYKYGFKSILVKRARQYFELPSSFKEFIRQCKWLGKGTNTIKDKNQRIKAKTIWFSKALFLVFPLFFLFNLKLFIIILIVSLGITYCSLVKRNKRVLLSFLALPFFYIKTFLVSFNIIRFWR